MDETTGPRLHQKRRPRGLEARPPVRRWPYLVAMGLIVLGFLVTLSWHDVLPGGWTLRGWVKPHHLREAEAWAEHRAQRLAFFSIDEAPDDAVVLLGSSTIEYLEPHGWVAPIANRGICFEPAEELRDRLEQHLPPAPRGFVVYAASIDFRLRGSEPERTRRLVGEVLARLEELRPGTPVALIGLLGEVDLDPERLDLLRRTNAQLAELCAERGAAFVDTARAPLHDADGRLVADYSTDGLHLNSEGYRILCRWISEDGGATGAILAGS